MTKDEALKLALEALESALSDDQPYIVKCGKAITAIKEALAQPEMRPDEISTDELIYMTGLYDGMKQERALWELSKLGQEIEAQPKHQPNCASLTTMLTSMPPKPASCDCKLKPPPVQPQRPWVGLTDEERSEIYNRMDWVIDFDWEYELAIEAKLKEKNT